MKVQLQLPKRRNNLFAKLQDNSVVILHSGYSVHKTADECHEFRVNNNFYYLANINQENSILAIGKSNGEYFEKLFIEEPTEYHEKWLGHQLRIDEASNLAQMDAKNIGFVSEFKSYLDGLLQTSRYTLLKIENVYLDLEKLDLPLFNTYALDLARKLKDEFPAVAIKDAYNLIVEQRMIKEDEEIKLMVESIKTTNNAILEAMKHHKEIKNESLAEAYYNFINTKEQKPLSFTSIVAGGVNATTLHYHANNSDLNGDELLLMDVGCYTDFYASDITRTFPLSGKFNDLQKQVYEIVLDCNKKCIEYATEGLSWMDLNNYANQILADGLIKLGLIKDHSELRRYYFHSIGHSVGLDVHDPANRALGLKAGMVITIEPGLYIKEWGIGIRIEDNILITKEKPIVLSKDIIKEVADIEAFLAK